MPSFVYFMNQLTIVLAFLAFGCGPAPKSGNTSNPATSAETLVGSATPAYSSKQIEQTVSNEPTPSVDDSLPRRVDAYTAISPVYSIHSLNCQNRDDEATESNKYARKCKGYGTYSLWGAGDDEGINYYIESDEPGDETSAVLLPLDTGEASAYARADLFTHKLNDKVEWCLDTLGTPYAVIVCAVFYKNVGTAKESIRAANKAAEFYFVRGLGRCKNLQADIPTTNTPYDPIEHARLTASRYYDRQYR